MLRKTILVGVGAFVLAGVTVPEALAATPVNLVAPALLDVRTPNPWDGDVLDNDRGSWDHNGDGVADPLADFTFTYQWYRCTSDTHCTTTIYGAANKTYTVVLADRSRWLYVKVSARHNGGTATSTNSNRVKALARPPANTSPPTVSGWPYAGQTLTSTLGTWTEPHGLGISYTRQWQRSADSQTWANISAATAVTYLPTISDIGYRVRIRVEARSSLSSALAYSDPTEPIAEAPPPPSNTALPVVTGIARQAQTLTVSNGDWSPSNPIVYSYRWQRCNGSEASCVDLSGASAATYIPTVDDVDFNLRARVTADNGGGQTTAFTALTPQVLTARPILVTAPQTYGTFNVGNVITSAPGGWSGDGITVAWQWLSCDANGTNCGEIFGATGSTLELPISTATHAVRLRETATNTHGSEVSSSRAVLVFDESGLDQLAFDFRPALLFDRGELWRPVSVEQWLAENTHEACWRQEYIYTANAEHFWEHECRPLTNENLAWAVDAPVPDADETKVKDGDKQLYVEFSHSANDGTDYNRGTACDDPNNVPFGVTLFDCDSGAAAKIYVHGGQDANGYRYLDYWIPYRYNDVEGVGNIDDHEGDWEGGSIALDTATGTPTVVGAIYAAHTDVKWVNATEVSAVVGCVSTCDSFVPTAPSGEQFRVEPHDFRTGSSHLAFFVAAGTHASYRHRCLEDCKNISAHGIVDEARTGGEAAWGENVDATCQVEECVRRFPNEFWASEWIGRWGSNIPNDLSIFGEPGGGAPSPLTQFRYTCTEVGWACAERDGVGVPNALFSFKAKPTSRRTPDRAPALEFCRSWVGGSIAAAVCNETLLRRAVEEHRLATPGTFRLRLRGVSHGSIPGLSQATGRPLRLGEAVYVSGLVLKGTLIFLNVEHKQKTRLVVGPVPVGRGVRIARAKLIDGRIVLRWSTK